MLIFVAFGCFDQHKIGYSDQYVRDRNWSLSRSERGCFSRGWHFAEARPIAEQPFSESPTHPSDSDLFATI
jgi:hypothetical protein